MIDKNREEFEAWFVNRTGVGYDAWQVWQAARNPKYTEGDLVEILKSANQGMNLFHGETEIRIIISILRDAGAIQVKE